MQLHTIFSIRMTKIERNSNIQCLQKLVKEEELKFSHTTGESVNCFKLSMGLLVNKYQ